MKRFSVLVATAALLAGLGWSLLAQEPARSTGHVLILQNQQVFEGDIDKIGDYYRVRKGPSELTVPAAQGLRLCADWDDALAFVHSRTKLNDPDERLRIARWLQINRQIDRARDEAKAALDLRPKHVETALLLKSLEITTTTKPNAAPPAALPAAASPSAALPPPQVDLSFEATSAFNLRVQPILMNTCVNCHAGSYGGKFRLYRLHEEGEKAATQRNLAAVMAQINVGKPAASPLLLTAVSAHGGSKTPPLLGKQSPAYFSICTWIDQTIADNPHLIDKAAPVPVSVPAGLLKGPKAPMASATAPLPGIVVSRELGAPAPVVQPVAQTPMVQTPMVPTPVVPPPLAPKTFGPAVAPGPRGEYDAGEFNERWHGKR